MNKVGVVIVNWNGGAIIVECLRHLLAQTDVEARILIVDNNSTDGSIQKIPELYPEVEILYNQHNAGFAVACNQGILHLHDCHWITILNPDAFPEPDWLRIIVDAAEESPTYHSFASMVVRNDNSLTIDSAGDVYMPDGRGVHHLQGLSIDKADSFPAEVFSATGAAALYRRASLIETGGFDQRFFCYYEDIDLGFRLQLLGYKCLLVPKAKVAHVGAGTTGGLNNDYSMFYCQRNFIWSFFKNMPSPLIFLYLPAHFIYVTGGLLRAYRLGKFRLVFRATIEAFVNLPAVLRDRCKVQSKRRISISTVRAMLGSGSRV